MMIFYQSGSPPRSLESGLGNLTSFLKAPFQVELCQIYQGNSGFKSNGFRGEISNDCRGQNDIGL